MTNHLLIGPPPESWWQRNRSRFQPHPAVQAALVTGLFAAIGFLVKTHSDASKFERDLKIAQATIVEQAQKLNEKTADIQRLETLLAPFRTIALERFTGSESEALRKLADQVTNIEKSLNDKSVEISRLQADLAKSRPESQPIRTATAKIELLKGGEGDGGGVMDFKLFAALGFGISNRPLLVLRNSDFKYRSSPVTNGVLRYTFSVEKDIAEDYGEQTLETLSGAEYIQIIFSPFPSDTEILGGNITCTFNGGVRRTIPITAVKYSDKAIIPIKGNKLLDHDAQQ